MALFLIVFIAAGLVLIGVAIPLVARRIKPNLLYGLRVPATFADEWVWYEANAKSGRDIMLLGAAEIIMAVALYQMPGLTDTAYALGNAAFLLIGALTMTVVGWRRANTLLEERSATSKRYL
jgi:uncharacterized membrane protein